MLACERLQFPPPRHGTFELFSGQATGWRVDLPSWRYPVVCQTESGTIQYDNFEGRWGDPLHLRTFIQRYAAEAAKVAARRNGHTVVEQPLSQRIDPTRHPGRRCVVKQIILLIEPDGKTTATAEGFEGSDCRLATAFLSQVLGPVSAEKLTPAYYQQSAVTPTEQENWQ